MERACWRSAIGPAGAPVLSTLASHGAKIIPIAATTPSPSAATPSSPDATRSASRWSPRSRSSTKVGTRTADSAPAARSSKRTFDTELVAWKLFPR